MLKHQPKFFENIRLRASSMWDKLEADPELAGPWHQLFQQVQSPRHVISELLQNADDARATEASVDIFDNCFYLLAKAFMQKINLKINFSSFWKNFQTHSAPIPYFLIQLSIV